MWVRRPVSRAVKAKRVVGGGFVRQVHAAVVDAAGRGAIDEEAAVGVVADQSDGRDRHGRIEGADGHRQIEAGSAAADLGRLDDGPAIHARPVVDEQVAIDAPRSGGQDAPAGHEFSEDTRGFSVEL